MMVKCCKYIPQSSLKYIPLQEAHGQQDAMLQNFLETGLSQKNSGRQGPQI
jgi:hypothetical protein